MCHEMCYLFSLPNHSVRQTIFISILQMRSIVITYCQLKNFLKMIKEDLYKKKKYAIVLRGHECGEMGKEELML